MLLVSGATATWRPLVQQDPDLFGVLAVPRDGNSLPEGVRWAADNGAFSGFDESAFLNMLTRHRWASDQCLWVAAPDVVGDAAATGALFDAWGARIKAMGYRVALVAQDGLTVASTPWGRIDALFLGGSTAWKLGPYAAHLTAAAHERGHKVHMGRVNTARRLRYASALGVDSVDGSGWSRFPAEMLRRHGSLLRGLAAQRRLAL